MRIVKTPGGRRRAPFAALLGAAFFLFLFPEGGVAEQFTDALGRVINIEREPKRIVSFAPSITEILFFLGLGDRVVGVTQFSNYPPEAASRPRVGSYVKLNVEKVISLAPDLAIGTVDGNSPANIRVLEEAGIKVYIINPRTVRDALATIRAIGEVCRSADRAKAAAEGLALRIRKVFERTSGLERPVVFLQINIRPIMSVNKNTFHQDVITLAGGINATRDEPLTYPRISIEEVIRINPDVIVISSMERGGEYEKARKEWFNWPGIKAVTGARVHLIDSDLLDRPSPRLVDGIEQMAAILHPGEGR